VGPILAIIIGLGVYPKVLLDVINPAVERTMIQIGQHDPAPVVPAEGAPAK
jgi:NADH-quinone oxidoreductase subunit M